MALFIAPKLVDDVPQVRIAWLILLATGPLLLSLLLHGSKILFRAAVKAWEYDQVVEALQTFQKSLANANVERSLSAGELDSLRERLTVCEAQALEENGRSARACEELEHARDALLVYASSRTPYHLERVVDFGGKMYVAIKRKPGRPLPLGTKMIVIDATDGSLMGRFRITQVRASEYSAVEDAFVNALWRGYVKGTGKSECSPPPNSAAYIDSSTDNSQG